MCHSDAGGLTSVHYSIRTLGNMGCVVYWMDDR